jgi:hypothetical protein
MHRRAARPVKETAYYRLPTDEALMHKTAALKALTHLTAVLPFLCASFPLATLLAGAP